MGKSQPSDKGLYPDGKASIIGVFLTGVILFFLSQYYPYTSANYWQSFGLMFAVFAIYFLDHFLDFRIIKGADNYDTRINKILAIISGVITLAFVVFSWRIFVLNQLYYFGFLGLLLYSVMHVGKMRSFLFSKEAIIAFTAAWVVCIKPAANMDYLPCVALGVVFLQNVLLYSFFEREKDAKWGFSNSFNTKMYSLTENTLIAIQFVLLIFVILLFVFKGIHHGIVVVSVSYFLLSFSVRKNSIKKYYRFLFDSILLGVLIP